MKLYGFNKRTQKKIRNLFYPKEVKGLKGIEYLSFSDFGNSKLVESKKDRRCLKKKHSIGSAFYMIDRKEIMINADFLFLGNASMFRTLAHEIGHHVWFHIMGSHKRKKCIKEYRILWSDSKLLPTTCAEIFSESFAFVKTDHLFNHLC